MRKVVISVFLMLAVAGTAMAQLDMDAKSFYAQGIVSLPTGDLGDFAGTGFGGGVGMTVPYSELLNFRAEAGYIMFGGKDFDGGLGVGTQKWSYSMIPIVALGEYKMKVEDPYFLLGGVGFTMLKASYDYSYPATAFTPAGSGSIDANSTEFTLTLGGGYEVNEQISIEGRYHVISNASYMSVHGTYAF